MNNYLKNVWTVWHAFLTKHNVYTPVITFDQMPLHFNESSIIKTMNSSGQSQNAYVKENHILSRERVIVMTTVGFTEKNSSKLGLFLQRKRNSYQTESSIKCYSPMGPKETSIKYVRKIFRKTNISNPVIRTRTYAYEAVRNVNFSENFAYVLNG